RVPSVEESGFGGYVPTGEVTELSVSLSEDATGIQWYVGFSGDQSQPIVDGTQTSLATAPIIGIERYWARISGEKADVHTSTATFYPIEPPELLAGPNDVFIAEGGTASFTVEAAGERLKYQWYRGLAGE